MQVASAGAVGVLNPSSWLDWFKALDWSHLNNVLGSIVAVTVLTGIGWAGIKFVWNPLAAWLGRRRAQSKLLDQLACGTSIEYVESLLGVAKFITHEDQREQRTYQLPGAWVTVELTERVVIAFTITITSRWMHYNVKPLTRGFLSVRLGKDKFGAPEGGYEGERLWVGPYRWSYLRRYYFHKGGGTPRYWLSCNMSGVGGGLGPPEGLPMFVETGVFCSDVNAPARSDLKSGLDASGITVNTLTVLHPDGPQDDFTKRYIFGPVQSMVRLGLFIETPWHRRILHRARFKKYQAKRKIKRILKHR